MKSFKKLAVLSMALLFAFGLSALTACNGGDSSSIDSSVGAPASESETSSEESKTYDYYEFTVLDKDGNKVADNAGYKVQLCIVNEQGKTLTCYNPVGVVSGVCVYNVIPENKLGAYEAHVLNASYLPVELKEVVTTSADAFGAYTLQLAN